MLVDQNVDHNDGVLNLSGFDMTPHIDDNSVAAPYSNQVYAPQVNDVQPPSNMDGSHDQPNQEFHGDIDVTAAASSLFGMAGQRSGGGGSMWGNFAIHMPQNDGHVSEVQGEQHPGGLSSSFTQSSSFTGIHQQSPANTMRFTQGYPSRNHSSSGHRPTSRDVQDYLDQDRYSHSQQSQRRQSHSKQDPRGDHETSASMQWGSDRNFSARGYRGYPPHFIERDESRFVLPIVTTNGHMRARSPESEHNQQYQPRRSSASELNIASSRHAGQSSALVPSSSRLDRAVALAGLYNGKRDRSTDQRFEMGQSRKRRRGQADLSDDDYDDEFVPSPPQAKPSHSKRARKLVKTEHSDPDVTPAKPYPARKTSKNGRALLESTSETPYSAGSPSSGVRLSAADEAARLNLTEDQKRGNHIKSEQRRRDLIKAQFDDIGTLVPVIKNSKTGFSRSDALFEAVRHIKKLAAGNAIMEGRYGVRFEKVFDKHDAEGEGE